MTKHNLWISSVLVVTVIVLRFAKLSEGQLLYLPSVWEFPHLSKTQVLPANEARHTPPSGRYAGSDNVNNPSPPKYLDSYFPAAMQLLHYYSERMQYAEHQSTTVAPPYTGGDYEVAGITPGGMKPQMTSTTSATTSTTAKTTTTTTTTTTPSPVSSTPPHQVESTTQPHRPGLFAPVPPVLQMQLDTQVAHDSVHAPTRKPITTRKPVQAAQQRPTTRKPLTTWASRKPWATTTKATRKPWTTKTRAPLTTKRKPAPPRESYSTTKRPNQPQSLAESSGFLSWFLENKSKNINQPKKDETLYDILDPLPKELLNEIDNEDLSLPALSDEDNVREFLKRYDDSFGRFVPSQTGNKVKPATKPYVEFLVLYDLLKRDAKEKMYSDYHGYTDNVLKVLAATSSMSSERQLHYVFSQLRASSEIQSAAIQMRMDSIIKDLENPYSITSKTIREIPSFVFYI